MTKQNEKRSPAATVAKERSRDDVVELSTGYMAKIVPVAASLITDVTTRIADPAVPTVVIEGKKKPEPNPDDPEYRIALGEANSKRATATMDAIVMFGVELVDGVPEGDGWLTKLKYMEKLGHLEMSGYDLDDPTDLEFVFKRYIAISAEDMAEVMRRSGVTEQAIAAATDTFPGDETR